KINRHKDETQQKTCDTKEATDAFLKDVPELFRQHWKRLLQIRHLFFHVCLNALAFGGAQLWRARRDCFRCRRSARGFWGGRDSRLRMRRRRWSRSDEPVCKTCRCRFRPATAEESERLIESIDRIHDVIASSFSIGRDLSREVRALYRNGRDEPRGQSTERKKGDGEEKSHRLGATERPARHFRHQRVQQISKNYSNGHRDQDRLKEANDIGAGPNHGADDHNEKNDT